MNRFEALSASARLATARTVMHAALDQLASVAGASFEVCTGGAVLGGHPGCGWTILPIDGSLVSRVLIGVGVPGFKDQYWKAAGGI